MTNPKIGWLQSSTALEAITLFALVMGVVMPVVQYSGLMDAFIDSFAV